MKEVVSDGSSGSTSRETRGFVWWVALLAFLVLYAVWTALPAREWVEQSSLCHADADGRRALLCRAALVFIYLFPDKYWITALPALVSVLLLLFVVGYCGVIILTSVSPTDRAAWRSDKELPYSEDESVGSQEEDEEERECHPKHSRRNVERQDIPLQAVSAALHLQS